MSRKNLLKQKQQMRKSKKGIYALLLLLLAGGLLVSCGADGNSDSESEEDTPKIEYSQYRPPQEPDCIGTMLSNEGNIVYLASGEVSIVHLVDQETGEEKFELSYEGDEIIVKIDSKTAVYKDVTDYSEKAVSESAESPGTIKQVLQPEDLPSESEGIVELTIWGEKNLDLVIAETIVYRINQFP